MTCKVPAMATCNCGLRIVVMFLFFCSGIAEPLRCTFPKDFSHRAKSTELWIQSREKRPVLDNWDRTQWSTIHKRLDSRANSTAWDVYESEANVDEFMHWTLKNAHSHPLSRRFTIAPVERPWWRADGSQVLSSFAAEELKHGETLLDLPVRFCLSNIKEMEDPTSLYTDGTPWEVQLVAKLLRERSKGWQSRWNSYIKLLPRFIPLPIFFSELEINNIQDKTTQDEVEKMQNFAKSTFQSLRNDEIAGAKFGDYVWALSVVYSSTCQLNGITGRKSAPIASHYMVPFFSANSEENMGVYAEYVDGRLKLIASDVKQGIPLTAEYASTTFRDTFLFHGFVPKTGQQDKITVFEGLQDLVDWYCSQHDAVNKNRYLTLKLAQDALHIIAASLKEFDTPSNDGLKHPSGDFSVGAGGYVDMCMISIFATLYCAEHAISGKSEIGTFTTIDLVVRNGTSAWERMMKDIALASISQYGSNALLDCNTSQASYFQPGFSSAKLLIQERLATFLDSFSTNIEEDMALLAAAEWEGMNELEGDQLGCPSCRWQTEQMSYHDNLAVQFRASLKNFIGHIVSELDCGASSKNNVAKSKGVKRTEQSVESLQEFLNWCEGHNLIISGKLAIAEITTPASDQAYGFGKYRGVVALEDIPTGHTLCTLPMSVGLYNNDSGSTSEVDTWDLAAARLLREKNMTWSRSRPRSYLRLAKVKDSNYAPYIAILPDYLPTPIHLDSQEIMEVQWMPMVRELVQVRKAIKESFGRLGQQELAWATIQEYEWAVTMVHSRAFTLPVRGDDKYEQYVLMPFMDMINHHYHYQADWTSKDVLDDKLEIISRRTLRKGEELFASFGPRSNDNLFLYYGFLLQDNPFDSAPIFGSYEEALKWFLNLWTHTCIGSSAYSVEETLCRQRNWQFHWYQMKDEMEEIESGGLASGSDWTELLEYWGDLGYQFLPYQPGPTIYPKGVIDPGLLAAFSTFYEVIDNVTKENEGFSPLPDPCSGCGNSTALGSSEMRTFFACLESQGTSPRGLLDGHVCQSSLDEVLRREKTLDRGMLLARISVALRCSEILASFSTTLDHDRELLTSSSEDCSIENSLACRTSQVPSQHLKLTWQYRYMKKLLLQAPINNVLKV